MNVTVIYFGIGVMGLFLAVSFLVFCFRLYIRLQCNNATRAQRKSDQYDSVHFTSSGLYYNSRLTANSPESCSSHREGSNMDKNELMDVRTFFQGGKSHEDNYNITEQVNMPSTTGQESMTRVKTFDTTGPFRFAEAKEVLV